jgi:hypothetical protein
MSFCSYTQLTEQVTAVDNSRLVTHWERPTGLSQINACYEDIQGFIQTLQENTEIVSLNRPRPLLQTLH